MKTMKKAMVQFGIIAFLGFLGEQRVMKEY